VRSRSKRSLVSMTLFAGMMTIVAAGCATGGAETRHGIGAGEWTASMPRSSSPIHELAFGRGGNSQRVDDLADLDTATPDAVLAPTTQEVAIVRAKRTAAKTPRIAYASNANAAKAETPELKPELQADRIAPPQVPEQVAQNDAAAESRYAEREQSAQDQQQFKGGDAIIITAGALVVVLLIVLLILLLR
jgi:hypothetical protein